MVYVDEIRPVIRSRCWPYNKACHLVADTISEMHAFARRLSLRRSWCQKHSSLPHYDLTENKRRQAIRLGAIEITDSQLVEMIREHRKGGD